MNWELSATGGGGVCVCVWGGVIGTFVTSNRFINYIGGMSFDTD